MALSPAAFAAALLREAQETHPWLHHPLFHMIYDGRLGRRELQNSEWPRRWRSATA